MSKLCILVLAFLFAQSAQAEPACAHCAAWNKTQQPFRIYGNTYYVGVHGLSSILITSDQGHVLIDGDLRESPAKIATSIAKLGFRIEDVKLILNSHVHHDHAGGIAKLQHLSGATVAASASSARVLMQGHSGPDDPLYGELRSIPAVRDVKIVKDGETLHVGSLELTAHLTPGHTPGVVTTEGITVYDGGKPYKAILWGGAGYRGGLADAEESVQSANKVARIQGVQVNLQIHSWAEPDGYPGGGVLERGLLLKTRKAGDPHPFVDPATFTRWVKRTQDNAAKAVQEEKQKAAK